MKHFNYTNNYTIPEPENTYIISIDESVNSKTFDEFYIKAFKLKGDYMGMSWSSFNDLLHGFYEIDKSNILFHHTHLPDFDDENLGIYIELLLLGVNIWTIYPEWNMEVVFSEGLKEQVEKVIAEQHVIDKVMLSLKQHPRKP